MRRFVSWWWAVRQAPLWALLSIGMTLLQASASAVVMVIVSRLVRILSTDSPVPTHTLWWLGVSIGITLTGTSVAQIFGAQWSRIYITAVERKVAESLDARGADPSDHHDDAFSQLVSDLRSWDFQHSVEALLSWIGARSSGLAAVAVLAQWNLAMGIGALIVFGAQSIKDGSLETRSNRTPVSEALTKRVSTDRHNLTHPGPAAEVRIHGLSLWLLDRYQINTGMLLDERLRSWHASFRARLSASWLVLLFYVTAIVWIFADLSRTAAAAPIAALQAMTRLSGLGTLSGTSRILRHHAEVITAVESLATSYSPRSTQISSVPAYTDSIVIEGVRFRYPNHSHDAVRDVSLHVPRGSVTTLVGANGAGKSSLVNLITGRSTPSWGSISVCGLAPRDAHEQGAVVELIQNPTALPLTVSDNAYPWPDPHNASTCSICTSLNIDRLARPKTPGHMDYLSGGERQRVAVARLLHSFDRGIDLLVLDEPSSALDIRTELQLMSLLKEMVHANPRRSALIVSHRFSTVRLADTIVVMDGGSITENGTHEELMKLGGIYSSMFQVQASPFTTMEDA